MLNRAALVALIVLLALQSPAQARDTGKPIAFRGTLERNGSAVTATLPMTFKLYAAAVGGSALWTESHPSVDVYQGVFNVVLGSITAFPPEVLASPSLFVEVTVDGALLQGRQPLHATPFSWGAVPAGSVMPFAGPASNIPPGWLPCEGQAVSRTTYAALFAAIGTSHGNGDGVSTFNLPDLRGRFLRGTDSGAGRDPDRSFRTAPRPGGNTGDAVGSVQGGATARPGNTFTTNTTGSHNHNNGNWNQLLVVDNAFSTTDGIDTTAGEPNIVSSRPILAAGDHAHSVTGGGDSETRPINLNVTFMIRY